MEKTKEKKSKKEMNEKRKIVLYFYWKCVFGSWTQKCCTGIFMLSCFCGSGSWIFILLLSSFFSHFNLIQLFMIFFSFFPSTSYKCILLDMHECYQSPILFMFLMQTNNTKKENMFAVRWHESVGVFLYYVLFHSQLCKWKY